MNVENYTIGVIGFGAMAIHIPRDKKSIVRLYADHLDANLS